MNLEITKYTSPNGVEILFINKDTPATIIELNFKAGFLCEQDIYETPHVLEHVLASLSTKHAISSTANGIVLNASTSPTDMRFTAKSPTETQKKAFDILLCQAFHQKTTQEALNTHIKIITTELSNRENDSETLTFEKCLSKIEPRIKISGDRAKHLKDIRLSHINSFRSRFIQPNNLKIIVAGNIDKEFADYTKTSVDSLISNPTTNQDNATPQYNQMSGVQEIENRSNMIIGEMFSCPKLSEKEKVHAHILSSYLFHPKLGKLTKKLRKDGIVYGIHGGIYPNLLPEAFVFGVFTKTKDRHNAEEAKNSLTNDINQIKGGIISQQTFEPIKNNLLYSEKMSRETIDSIASYYRDTFFAYGKIRDYNKTLNYYRNASADDIQKIAQKIFTSN